jgi:hypothetical protein
MQPDPATNLLMLQSELIGKQLDQIAALQAQIRALDGTNFKADVLDAGNGFYAASFDGAPVLCEFEGGADGVEVVSIFINGEGIEPHHLMGASRVSALESEIANHCATRNEACKWEMTL